MKISVPCYYTKKFMKKKDEIVLLGMNWYRNEHWTHIHSAKVFFADLIKGLIENPIRLDEYEVEYVYFYKNKSSDLSNVCSLVSKFFNDAIQDLGMVEDDNVQFLKRETFIVGGEDKENPRVEIYLKPHENSRT